MKRDTTIVVVSVIVALMVIGAVPVVGASDPSPQIIEVSYPSLVYDGQKATITVTAKNNGGFSDDGYISVSFPNDEDILESDVYGTGNDYNNLYPKGYWPLYDSAGQQMVSVDPLVELHDINWGEGREERITVSVSPTGAKQIVFYVRVALENSGGTFIRAPASSSYIDQQGWYVNRYTIDVVYPPPLLWKYKTDGGVSSVSISSDGNYVAAGASDKNVYLFDKVGTQLWKNPTGGNIYSIDISSDGDYVAASSVSWDDSSYGVYLFDKAGTQLWRNPTGGNVRSVSISSDGNYVAAGSSDGKCVYLFDRTGTQVWKNPTDGYVYSVSISSDGNYVAAGSAYDNYVYLFDKAGTRLWRNPTGGNVGSVSISSDGNYVAAGSNDRYVYLFDKTGTRVWKNPVYSSANSVSISSDGDYVASGTGGYGSNNNFSYFDKGGNKLWNYPLDTYISAFVSVSDDGSYIAAGSHHLEPFTVYFFNKGGILLWKENYFVNSDAVRISSDGNYIAVGSGNYIYLFDAFAELQIPLDFVPEYITTGDLDNNGRNDIVTSDTNQSNPVMNLYSQQSDHTFIEDEFFDDGAIASVSIGDMDDNGFDDIAGLYGYIPTEYAYSGVRVWYRSGGGFGSYVDITFDDLYPNSLSVDDLNDDGLDDIAIIGNGNISIFYQQVDHTFNVVPDHTLMGGSVYYWPWSIITGDINNDGLNDIAAVGYSGPCISCNGILFFHQTEDHSFVAAPFGFGDMNTVLSCSIGDLNNDELNDIAIARSDYFGSAVLIYHQKEDNTFNFGEHPQDADKIILTDSPVSISVCDLNDDGLDDIAVGNRDSKMISIYYQTVEDRFFHYYPTSAFPGEETELTVIVDLTQISMNIGDPVQWYITTPSGETITGESDTLKCCLAGGLYDRAYYDFPESGTYTIRVEFPGYTEYAEWDVEVAAPPTASFTHITSCLTASFTSTSRDSDGYLTAHNWDFGDGKTSAEEDPTHTYAIGGDYDVTLTVTDNDGYKNSKTETISVGDGTINRVSHPSDFPFGTKLTIEVKTNLETDITLDLDTFHQTLHGTDATFDIDTSTLTKGEHTLTVTAGSDTYADSIIIYDPAIYQAITKELDDLGTCSKDEMSEISGITGKTLTNHVYKILLGVEVEEDVTAGDVLNNLRTKLGEIGDKVTIELEMYKNILITIDSTLSDEVDDMDPAINSITNIQNEIKEVNDQVSDEKIVESINEYVTKPAVYRVICADEENSIDTRTQTTKSSLDPYYTQNQLDETNEILSIGKEAIKNTNGEQIYRLDIGTVFGHEISAKPTLDHLNESQTESLNPPADLCAFGKCIPGKYHPVWVYHLTVADAESILTIPAHIGWIDATPENEIIESMFAPMAVIVTATTIIKAAKAYMKYVDMLEKFSPWLIDGGMIVSTDLLAKEIDEEHADVIEAISDTLQSRGAGDVDAPTFTSSGLHVPEGNILVTTSPDGKIRNFEYVKSDSVLSTPKNRRVISLNTGWSQSFGSDPQNILITIAANKSSYNISETVNLTVNISSDAFIEDAMLWIFVPESNTTLKDIFNVAIGDMNRTYNFTIQDEMWHVPRVYITDFGTTIAENYTSFGVGSQSRETGIISMDYSEFYDPGMVSLNVTIHNAGNTPLSATLEYSGSHPCLTGSIELPVLQAGEQTTEQLKFDLTTPDVYEMYFILNASNDSTGMFDYNTARFTVTARDTLFAFPSTDKPIYNASEGVNIAVTVKNVTLDVIPFPYSLTTKTPSGETTSETSFVPDHNGTYIVKATPIAEGYCVVEEETLFIVEKQSNLVIETRTLCNTTTITVKTDLGGVVETADVVVNGYKSKTDESGVVEFGSFNTSRLIIKAEKFGFNPAVVSVNVTAKIRGDLNSDGTLTPADAVIALHLAASGGWDPAADMNSDDCITSLDALMILSVTPTTQSSRAPPCDSYGDVDDDGYVTIDDYDLVCSYAECGWDAVKSKTSLTSEEEFKRRADIDGDDKVSFSDSVFIDHYINGTRDTFPLCP